MEKKNEELLDTKHLRYFIALAEELHFARAAERLRMEQSPLSRAIREMERLLGVRLFERNTRSTRITRSGKVLLEYARRAVELMEQAQRSARSAALGYGKQLRIGVSDSIAYARVIDILVRYGEMHSDLSTSVFEMPLSQQIMALRDDLLDAAISLDGAARTGIEADAITSDPVCAVLSADHPLTRSEGISRMQMSGQPLILFSAESDLGGNAHIDGLANVLTNPVIAYRASSLGTMLAGVALGHGIGLVGTAQLVGVRHRNLVTKPISDGGLSVTTYVLRSSCGLSEPLEGFIQLARDVTSTADWKAMPS